MRERLHSPTCQGVGLDWKITIFCLQPNHNIIGTQRDGVIMQPPKKGIYFLQLPIIELSNKPQTPTTPISNINYPSIFRRDYRIKIQKGIPQRQIPTPPILPKLHPVLWANLKTSFIFESISSISNCRPNPHFIPLLCTNPPPLAHAYQQSSISKKDSFHS